MTLDQEDFIGMHGRWPTTQHFKVGVKSDGTLTAISSSPFSTGKTPSAVAVDPSGSFVYVTNSGDNNISIFTINSNNSLTSGGTMTTGTSPSSLVVTK